MAARNSGVGIRIDQTKVAVPPERFPACQAGFGPDFTDWRFVPRAAIAGSRPRTRAFRSSCGETSGTREGNAAFDLDREVSRNGARHPIGEEDGETTLVSDRNGYLAGGGFR